MIAHLAHCGHWSPSALTWGFGAEEIRVIPCQNSLREECGAQYISFKMNVLLLEQGHSEICLVKFFCWARVLK